MTQLAPRTESFGAGDQSWLASRHGTETAKTATLDPTDWAGKISDGRIKSGEPFAIEDGMAVPYDANGGSPANVLVGFILTDQSVRSDGGNVTFPAVWHGRIILSKLPSPVAANAQTSGLFVLEG